MQSITCLVEEEPAISQYSRENILMVQHTALYPLPGGGGGGASDGGGGGADPPGADPGAPGGGLCC